MFVLFDILVLFNYCCFFCDHDAKQKDQIKKQNSAYIDSILIVVHQIDYHSKITFKITEMTANIKLFIENITNTIVPIL